MIKYCFDPLFFVLTLVFAPLFLKVDNKIELNYYLKSKL